MAGGAEADVARAAAVLAPLAASVVRCGPVGAGQAAKACNQLVVACAIEAVGEALALARSAGCDPAAVREALLGGYAASRVLELHGERMLRGDFAPGGRAETHLKDLRIARALADEGGVTLPALGLMLERFAALVDAGGGALDHSAVVTLL
jgi:3-hydroxyisobutyrate dehydrogenase-like beta-hydroxyacid dehydrogenase